LGNNAFLLAALCGYEHIFTWLLSDEANALGLDKSELSLEETRSDCDKQTAFLAAVYGNRLQFIVYLLEKYKDINFLNQKDRLGKNAFQIAESYYNHSCKEGNPRQDYKNTRDFIEYIQKYSGRINSDN
jgi:ankyrin repeat protein